MFIQSLTVQVAALYRESIMNWAAEPETLEAAFLLVRVYLWDEHPVQEGDRKSVEVCEKLPKLP